VADKIGEYLECGVPLVWLVDPGRKRLRLPDADRCAAFELEDILSAEPVLPLSCRVSQFF
jgi:Uma2 family endonuclease